MKEQLEMLKRKRLVLSRKRMTRHFGICLWSIGGAIFALLLQASFFLSGKNVDGRDGQILILVLILISIILAWIQYRKLKFKRIQNHFSSEENKKIVNDAIESLNWKIAFKSKYFIEAINPKRDYRSWGDEMISIVVADQEILVNSICNVDSTRMQAFLSFGKNKENVRKLFEQIKINSTLDTELKHRIFGNS